MQFEEDEMRDSDKDVDFDGTATDDTDDLDLLDDDLDLLDDDDAIKDDDEEEEDILGPDHI